MATWATDVRGLNLARHVPTAAEQRMARLVAKRWAKWSPILLLEMRKRPQPLGYVAKEMQRFEAIHRARIFRLVDHYRREDYPGHRIAEYSLDDPRTSDDAFELKLTHALAQRRGIAAGKAKRKLNGATDAKP